MHAPKPEKRPVNYALHGYEWSDEFAWLREKDNPETIRHLEAENEFTSAAMAETDPLQRQLYDEILSRIQQTDLTVPVKDGTYFYYSRTDEGRQYPRYCRRAGTEKGTEEIYLDANELAEGHGYFRVGVLEVSQDHRLAAYSTDVEGDEDYLIRVKDLESGLLLEDRIERTYDSLEWTNDNRSFFYNVLDETRRPYRVFRHRLGEAASADVLVREEADKRFTLDIVASRSRQYLILDATSSTTTELSLLAMNQPEGEFRVFRERQQDIEYSLTHQGDWFYIRINDRGRNFRLVRTPVHDWRESTWEEVIAHRADVYLEGVTAFKEYLVLTERCGGLRRYRYQRRGETEWRSIEFPEAAFSVSLIGNVEYNTAMVRYQYQSPVTPPSVFDFHFATGEHELKKRTEVPGGFEPERYQVERTTATSHDGTQVPLVLVSRRDLDKTKPNSLLLYGYGAYGMNTDAAFSSGRFSLIDRGVIYAMAQVRGGAEMGQPWHDAGRMLEKKNSFLDFIACAEHLVKHGVTSEKQMVIEGGSAGGLLVGACVTMRPELFGGVLAHVPFVDVVHTMLDATLPLTVGEYEEWGNPMERKFFEAIRAYSPYDNTHFAKYPPMLVTAGLNDPRVSYWEPAKWVARLREANEGASEILLKVNMGAGHFGASGRYDRIGEIASEYAWLLRTFR